MSTFKYIEKDGKIYLTVDGKRLDVEWEKRFVPTVDEVEVLPSSITLSKSSYTIKVEGHYTLSATILPENTSDKEIVWSSSDETIAIVNEQGQITGIGVGEAVITVTSLSDSSVKANCSITVQAKE